jgi:hypothetical protein
MGNIYAQLVSLGGAQKAAEGGRKATNEMNDMRIKRVVVLAPCLRSIKEMMDLDSLCWDLILMADGFCES